MQVVNDGSIEQVSLENLQTHPKNPRKGNVKAIAQAIKKSGFYGALIVQRSSGHILAGNHTFLALQELGEDEAPVIYVDVDDETATRILLADNRLADLGTYDNKVLAELLEDTLHTTDNLSGTGYARSDLDKLLKQLEIDSETDFLDDLTKQAQAQSDQAKASLSGGGDGSAERPSPPPQPSGGQPPNPGGGSGQSQSAGGYEDVKLYQVTYPVTKEQRDTIYGAVDAAKESLGLSTSMEGLAAVCQNFLDSYGGNREQ